MRNLLTAGAVTLAALLGVVVQAGSYLLALPSSPSHTAGTPLPTAQGAIGVQSVGYEVTSLPMTVWYPANAEAGEARGPQSYTYGLRMFSPRSTTALATYMGRAIVNAEPDVTDGPYPLVILSHGFAITPSSYAWLAEHLASQGFVVIAPDHIESLDPGTLWRSTFQRTSDVSLVMRFATSIGDAGRELAGLVDTDRVGVVGHSYGGFTALAAAGARIDPAQFAQSCTSARGVDSPLVFLCDALEPRLNDLADLAGVEEPAVMWPAFVDEPVDAVVSIAGDAAMFGANGLSRVTVPAMLIGGTADLDSPFVWGTRLSYEHISSTRKIEIALEGAGHMVFAGRCEVVRRVIGLMSLGFCADEGWDQSQVHELVKDQVALFLAAELKGDKSAKDALTRQKSRGQVTFQTEGY